MSSGRETAGHVARLFQKRRHAADLSQAELAKRAKVSRSRIIAAEAATSLPTLPFCLKVARALAIPAPVMVRAFVQDSVQECAPSAVAGIASELWGGTAHWEAIAEHQGVQIGHGVYRAVVNPCGDVVLTRTLSGCNPLWRRQSILFRDRIIGEQPPKFAVKSSPHGFGYNMNVTIEGEWAQHRIEMHRPWAPEDGTFELEFETLLPSAYVMDLNEHNRRRSGEGLSPLKTWSGDYRAQVTYSFETLELELVFPEGYRPEWQEPTATWGSAPLSDYERHQVTDKCCRSQQFVGSANSARLLLEYPVPGYTFGIRWTVPGEWRPVEGVK